MGCQREPELDRLVESLEFTIYKYKKVVCTNMDLLCLLTQVKLANTGRYHCTGKYDERLTVKGVFAVRDTVLLVGD